MNRIPEARRKRINLVSYEKKLYGIKSEALLLSKLSKLDSVIAAES